MRFKNDRERYDYHIRRERAMLEAFVQEELENADTLLYVYRKRGEDMPDDIYRAAAFFINAEYREKCGSLALLFGLSERVKAALPERTTETALDQMCYRFRAYTAALAEGGF